MYTTLEDQERLPVVVVSPKLRPYAYTLRKTKNPESNTKGHYVNHIAKLSRKGLTFQDNNFEMKAGLHMHGVVQIPDGFNMKTLKIRGWHLFLREIFDPQGWQKYIIKEQLELVSDDDRQKFNDYIRERFFDTAEKDPDLVPGQGAQASSSVEAER